LAKAARRFAQGQGLRPPEPVQQTQGGDPYAAPRQVDDALEGEVVVGRMDHVQIGERVADLLALVEAGPADHRVRDAERDEALLELARLKARPHQHGHAAQGYAPALLGLDLLADEAGLLLAIPDPAYPDPFAFLCLGPQGLAEPALVMGDQA